MIRHLKIISVSDFYSSMEAGNAQTSECRAFDVNEIYAGGWLAFVVHDYLRLLYHSKANCSLMLNRRPLMSCFIHQPLASEAFNRDASPLRIVNAEFRASVHAEVEFSQIPVQMFLVHVLIYTDQTAFEDREEPFKGIGMHVAARPFVLRVVNRFVLISLTHVDGRAIGNEAAAVVKMLDQMVTNVLVLQVHRPNIAATLYQGQHDFAAFGVQGAVVAGLRRAGQKGFIGLNRHVRAANRTSIGRRRHRQPNPMAHEPCGLHAAAEHPLKLTRADAFLAGAHQVNRLKPMGHRRVAVLENGANLDRKLLAAVIALAQASPRGLASQFADAGLIAVAAVRANRTVRPQPSLNVGVGGLFVF